MKYLYAKDTELSASATEAEGIEEHRRLRLCAAQRDERRRAGADRPRVGRSGRERNAQTGADIRHPASADREGGIDLLRGRARSAAGGLRVLARAGAQLSAQPGRRLRRPVANSQV